MITWINVENPLKLLKKLDKGRIQFCYPCILPTNKNEYKISGLICTFDTKKDLMDYFKNISIKVIESDILEIELNGDNKI